MFADNDLAPHTITFLNGAKEPDAVVPQPQPNGPPLLVLNPDVALPQNADKPLTTQGIYNSGLIDPHMPGPHMFSLKIGDMTGDISYLCELHDESGMKGTLSVSP
jgi:plastocyanin